MGFFRKLFFGNKTDSVNENVLPIARNQKTENIPDLNKIKLDITRINDIYEIFLDNQAGIELSIQSISCKIENIIKQNETIHFVFSSPSLKKTHILSIQHQFEIGVVEFVQELHQNLQSSETLVKINFTKEAIDRRHYEEERKRFTNIPLIKNDPFLGSQNFKWEYVGGILAPYDFGKYGIVTSSDDGFLLIISFIKENDKIYLLINYFTDTLSTQNARFKIFENDKIQFLFEDRSVKDFIIKDKTLKPLDKTGMYVDQKKFSGIHQNSIEINEDILNIFATKNLLAWKLNIKKYNLEIIGNKSGHGHYIDFKDCQFALKNLASDLFKLILMSSTDLIEYMEDIEIKKLKLMQPEAKEYDPDDRDPMFEEAARLIVMHQQGSTSLIQRKMKLGYNRAGRIIDQLEAAGIVGAFEGSKARDVLYPDEYSLERYLETLQKPKD
ncbi:hypothetical protein HDF22_006000 [Mucilaginibacter lappiensis]|uniref:FtsK gamma domain-containing protein n=1 Tax=Mucilaginibacter lappiensis TaxID=354630 RepID=A0A841JQF3_9SPHI|nr:DNA translocase FtsK [Mucilaginibacter lappiensis]MBB6131846.1 hypothetical protein [Mucilaginibacter lappiensis]